MIGEFSVTCDTDSGLVGTADQGQYVRVFGHPDITAVSPQHEMIEHLNEV